MKKILFTWLMLFLSYFTFGQSSGIKGVVATQDGNPATGAYVSVSGLNNSIQTNEDGTFVFENIKAGNYQLIIVMEGYENYFSDEFEIKSNEIKDLGTIKLTASSTSDNEGGDIVNADDLNNEQGAENISPLLSGSRDVFLNSAAYSLGPMRFKIRGYQSNFTDITINGVAMGNMETGRTYWSNWGGLNNVT